MFLDAFQNSHRIVRIDQVDGDALFTETSGPSYPMQVSFAIRLAGHVINWQVKVDHDCHLFHVDS